MNARRLDYVNGIHHAAMAKFVSNYMPALAAAVETPKCRVAGCAAVAGEMNLLCEPDFNKFARSGEWPRFEVSTGHRAMVALTDWLMRTELERRNAGKDAR